jgi:hypothetical protein
MPVISAVSASQPLLRCGSGHLQDANRWQVSQACCADRCFWCMMPWMPAAGGAGGGGCDGRPCSGAGSGVCFRRGRRRWRRRRGLGHRQQRRGGRWKRQRGGHQRRRPVTCGRSLSGQHGLCACTTRFCAVLRRCRGYSAEQAASVVGTVLTELGKLRTPYTLLHPDPLVTRLGGTYASCRKRAKLTLWRTPAKFCKRSCAAVRTGDDFARPQPLTCETGLRSWPGNSERYRSNCLNLQHRRALAFL